MRKNQVKEKDSHKLIQKVRKAVLQKDYSKPSTEQVDKSTLNTKEKTKTKAKKTKLKDLYNLPTVVGKDVLTDEMLLAPDAKYSQQAAVCALIKSYDYKDGNPDYYKNVDLIPAPVHKDAWGKPVYTCMRKDGKQAYPGGPKYIEPFRFHRHKLEKQDIVFKFQGKWYWNKVDHFADIFLGNDGYTPKDHPLFFYEIKPEDGRVVKKQDDDKKQDDSTTKKNDGKKLAASKESKISDNKKNWAYIIPPLLAFGPLGGIVAAFVIGFA